MKRVAIISKPEKPELKELVPKLIQWFQARGYEAVVDPETASYAPGLRTVARNAIAQEKPQFALVLGGDGTLLAAARAVARDDIPILGVNLGSLGFLTEILLSELFENLEAVECGKCTREPRSMLECQVERTGKTFEPMLVLNDLVVSKGTIARMTEVEVTVDGGFVANFKADGVIIATPTGSTAYSLAAGGPILEPTVDAFVITPISPHALTNRPLVVRDHAEIVLTVREVSGDASLTADGQVSIALEKKDRIVCCKSIHTVQLLRIPGRTFFDVLRLKLKWGER